jgi:hypothetical protein
MIEASEENQCKDLRSPMLLPRCPICLKLLPGCYESREDGFELGGFYFFVGCLESCPRACFARGYMVQGVRMKFPPLSLS